MEEYTYSKAFQSITKTPTVLARIDPAQNRHLTVDILARYHELIVGACAQRWWHQLKEQELHQQLSDIRPQFQRQRANEPRLIGGRKVGALEVTDVLARHAAAAVLNCAPGRQREIFIIFIQRQAKSNGK